MNDYREEAEIKSYYSRYKVTDHDMFGEEIALQSIVTEKQLEEMLDKLIQQETMFEYTF